MSPETGFEQLLAMVIMSLCSIYCNAEKSEGICFPILCSRKVEFLYQLIG